MLMTSAPPRPPRRCPRSGCSASPRPGGRRRRGGWPRARRRSRPLRASCPRRSSRRRACRADRRRSWAWPRRDAQGIDHDEVLHPARQRRMIPVHARVEHRDLDILPLRRLPGLGDLELLQAPGQPVLRGPASVPGSVPGPAPLPAGAIHKRRSRPAARSASLSARNGWKAGEIFCSTSWCIGGNPRIMQTRTAEAARYSWNVRWANA